MAIIYFALGSNISSRLHYLRSGLNSLQSAGLRVTKVSSVYKTSPVGVKNQDYFLNAVAKANTPLKPMELLRLFKKIEKRWGRRGGARNKPRTLDLDLLLYDRVALKTPKLTLPHPRMEKRKFVLVPLLEIAPALKNPAGISYKSCLRRLSSEQTIKVYRRKWRPSALNQL